MNGGFNLNYLVLCVPLMFSAVEVVGNTSVKDGDVIQPRLDILRKKYLKNADQTWKLVANKGHWALVFHYLSIEKSSNCQHDYLEIHDTAPSDETPYAPIRYCGEITPLPYISKTSQLTIRFVSDSIWELKGFNITAFYGEEKDKLVSKVYEMVNKYTVTLALEAEETQNDKDREKGALFYVLIGSSAAAFVLFGILLVYFVIVMRRQIYTHKVRVPKLYYISGVAQTQNVPSSNEPFVKLNSGPSTIKSAQELCKTGKRRYSKEKKSTKPGNGETAVKFVEPSCRSQHNNMYISSNLVHVCKN